MPAETYISGGLNISDVLMVNDDQMITPEEFKWYDEHGSSVDPKKIRECWLDAKEPTTMFVLTEVGIFKYDVRVAGKMYMILQQENIIRTGFLSLIPKTSGEVDKRIITTLTAPSGGCLTLRLYHYTNACLGEPIHTIQLTAFQITTYTDIPDYIGKFNSFGGIIIDSESTKTSNAGYVYYHEYERILRLSASINCADGSFILEEGTPIITIETFRPESGYHLISPFYSVGSFKLRDIDTGNEKPSKRTNKYNNNWEISPIDIYYRNASSEDILADDIVEFDYKSAHTLYDIVHHGVIVKKSDKKYYGYLSLEYDDKHILIEESKVEIGEATTYTYNSSIIITPNRTDASSYNIYGVYPNKIVKFDASDIDKNESFNAKISTEYSINDGNAKTTIHSAKIDDDGDLTELHAIDVIDGKMYIFDVVSETIRTVTLSHTYDDVRYNASMGALLNISDSKLYNVSFDAVGRLITTDAMITGPTITVLYSRIASLTAGLKDIQRTIDDLSSSITNLSNRLDDIQNT